MKGKIVAIDVESGDYEIDDDAGKPSTSRNTPAATLYESASDGKPKGAGPPKTLGPPAGGANMDGAHRLPCRRQDRRKHDSAMTTLAERFRTEKPVRLDTNIEYGMVFREQTLVRRVREDMLDFARLGSVVNPDTIQPLLRYTMAQGSSTPSSRWWTQGSPGTSCCPMTSFANSGYDEHNRV